MAAAIRTPPMALLVWLVALVAVGQQGEYLSAVEAKKLIGRVNDRRIKEASGLVASRKNKGVLWTHNDSGDRARVFAISTEDGHVLHELSVRGAGARDWEDLALSPSGKLCAGDTGGSQGRRRWVTVYCFDEPRVDTRNGAKKKYSSTSATPYHLDYPGNDKYDSETLLIDRRTNTWCVVTKQDEHNSRLYTVEDPKPWNHNVMTFRRKVRTYGGWAGPVAGDISWDGERVVLKSYGYYFYLYTRAAFFANTTRDGEGAGRPHIVGTDYNGAEAVAFAPGKRNTVYTLTEGAGSPLHSYYI